MNEGSQGSQQRQPESQDLRELDERMRMRSEAAVRAVLDECCPAGFPDDLMERICLIQNRLIREVVQSQAVIQELRDDVSRVSGESAQRWMGGFRECANQVRMHANELNLVPQVVESLLRMDVRPDEESREDRNEAASQRVEWKRA